MRRCVVRLRTGLRSKVEIPKKGSVDPVRVHLGADVFVMGTFVLELIRDLTAGTLVVGGVVGLGYMVVRALIGAE